MKPVRLTLIAACFAGAAFALPSMAATASASLSMDSVNAAGKNGPAAKPGTAEVLRAQIMLDRAHFSSGEIDGATGGNLRAAIAGYQKAHGIDGAGSMNAATWTALNADSADALTSYTIADADVAGPFQAIPEDMADKAKLPSLGYASAEEALAEKFHASPALLKRLNPGKDLARAGEQIVVPNVEGTEPLPKGGKIVVDKSSRTLTLFDTAGKAIAQFPASTGSEHDPLPVGEWKVTGISKNPVFYYNPKLFWDADAGEKKAKIPAGPNNPVGVAWINLSKPHYGIHGTPVPASIGKTQSHGCIRLTNWDVMALVASVATGTEVLLQD
ncbi:MAG: L,D-transpeptidase family protein [Pseudomonadota bacterium]|nr:L,D-transpeptidase family protein [Pseudomonadota bacterium]